VKPTVGGRFLPGAWTTLLDDAVKTFLDTKAASGVTEKHTATLKFSLFSAKELRYLLAGGLLARSETQPEPASSQTKTH